MLFKAILGGISIYVLLNEDRKYEMHYKVCMVIMYVMLFYYIFLEPMCGLPF